MVFNTVLDSSGSSKGAQIHLVFIWSETNGQIRVLACICLPVWSVTIQTDRDSKRPHSETSERGSDVFSGVMKSDRKGGKGVHTR